MGLASWGSPRKPRCPSPEGSRVHASSLPSCPSFLSSFQYECCIQCQARPWLCPLRHHRLAPPCPFSKLPCPTCRSQLPLACVPGTPAQTPALEMLRLPSAPSSWLTIYAKPLERLPPSQDPSTRGPGGTHWAGCPFQGGKKPGLWTNLQI